MKIIGQFLLYLLLSLTATAQPAKVDFSSEWAKELDNYPGGKPALEEIRRQDLSSFFLSQSDRSENGVFDSMYWRIQFHIHSVVKDPSNPLRYFVKGKSKLRPTVMPFEGSLTITQAKRYSTAYEMNDQLYRVRIVAQYIFTEDSTQLFPGIFSGTLRSDLTYIPSKPDSLGLYDEGEDGFMNNTYVGMWTSKKGKKKLCIWGLERLPFTGDWDEGAGEIAVNKKYVKFGWQSYMKHNEFVEKNGVYVQKDQWWK